MDLGLLILGLLAIMLGPPVVFVIIGFIKRKTDRNTSTVFFILGVAWLVIGGGICASMMS